MDLRKYVVSGLERVDYTSKKTGNPVRGYRVHCAYKDDKIQGMGAEVFFFGDSVCDRMPGLNDRIHVFYNQYGKPCGWEPAK